MMRIQRAQVVGLALVILGTATVSHAQPGRALRDRVQQALVYPAILVVLGVLMVTLFMTVMVPQLMKFFTDTNQELPPATRLLMSVHSAFTHYWWAGAIGVFGIVGGRVQDSSGRLLRGAILLGGQVGPGHRQESLRIPLISVLERRQGGRRSHQIESLVVNTLAVAAIGSEVVSQFHLCVLS